MRKGKWIPFLLTFALCVTTTGCWNTDSEESSMPLTSPSASVSEKPSQSGFVGGNVGPVGSQPVSLSSPHQMRIEYRQGVANSVVCVSSQEELTAYGVYGNEQLASYDPSFFEDHALVLVKYTVNSGSTKVSLGRAYQVSDVISLQMDTQPAGIGTADMATWLLWAEVDKSLGDCKWVLEGQNNTGSGVTQ